MAKDPGAGMGVEADAWVIGGGGWGGEKDEHGTGPHLFAGQFDQAFPDALALMGDIDGEIGEVTDVGEVGEGAGDTDEPGVVPGGDDEGGVVEHVGDDGGIIDGPTLGEGGGVEKGDDLVDGRRIADAIGDHGKGRGQTRDWPEPS